MLHRAVSSSHPASRHVQGGHRPPVLRAPDLLLTIRNRCCTSASDLSRPDLVRYQLLSPVLPAFAGKPEPLRVPQRKRSGPAAFARAALPECSRRMPFGPGDPGPVPVPPPAPLARRHRSRASPHFKRTRPRRAPRRARTSLTRTPAPRTPPVPAPRQVLSRPRPSPRPGRPGPAVAARGSRLAVRARPAPDALPGSESLASPGLFTRATGRAPGPALGQVPRWNGRRRPAGGRPAGSARSRRQEPAGQGGAARIPAARNRPGGVPHATGPAGSRRGPCGQMSAGPSPPIPPGPSAGDGQRGPGPALGRPGAGWRAGSTRPRRALTSGLPWRRRGVPRGRGPRGAGAQMISLAGRGPAGCGPLGRS